MHREEEIVKGSCDEKRVSNSGSIFIQAESIKNCIEEAPDAEKGKMFLHTFGINSILFFCFCRVMDLCGIGIVNAGIGCRLILICQIRIISV